MDARAVDGSAKLTLASKLTNAQLLDMCESGDQRAWSEVVNRYERLVYAVALREGCDSHAASDITQETFGALLGSLRSIDNAEHLGSWLSTVCRRAAWRRRSSATTNESALSDLAESPVPDFTDNLVGVVEVYEAIQQLGSPCRHLIYGLFFDPDEPDYATIAVRLGRPLGSIGPLRGRCLVQLKALLQAGLANG